MHQFRPVFMINVKGHAAASFRPGERGSMERPVEGQVLKDGETTKDNVAYQANISESPWLH